MMLNFISGNVGFGKANYCAKTAALEKTKFTTFVEDRQVKVICKFDRNCMSVIRVISDLVGSKNYGFRG